MSGIFTTLISIGAMLLSTAAFADPAAERALIADLVTANHILADQGVVDGFGHISVRSEINPNHYYMARSMAPALVTAADIVEYDMDSNPLDAGERKSYLERFIHGEILKARPGVKSVIHSHATDLIPFGITATPMRPVYHMSSFLGGGVPVFDIRAVAGPTDLLVRNATLGQALARTLGDKAVCLMRGHGAVMVGGDIHQAVFRAVYTGINAKLQAEAQKMGPVTFLADDEAALAAHTNDGQIGRTWDLWKRKVEAER
jgi:ribulose-5-phosphate 4-epimerase/fuculose-1-phosphate aldolase